MVGSNGRAREIARAAAALALAGALLFPVVATRADDRASSDAASEFTARERRIIARLSELGPPPSDPTNRVADDPTAARLGQQLFFDRRLSLDGNLSCASCHDPRQAFTDGKRLATGRGTLTRNTPSIYNVAHQRWFFWDGRIDTLWGQALEPLERLDEMAANRMRIARTVLGDPKLARSYRAVFGAPPALDDRARFPADARPALVGDPEDDWSRQWTAMAPADREIVDRVFANLGKALAAYQRRVVSRSSAFDRFARGLRDGDADALAALGPDARRGLKIFIGGGGCRTCHGGPLLSDLEFHDTRVAPSPTDLPVDPGRHRGIERVRDHPFGSAGPHSDAPDGERSRRLRRLIQVPRNHGEFKTPSLRNVALTAPYMHQGQFATLEEVVRFYSTRDGALPPGHHDERILQPLGLSAAEQADLIAFLKSLTDDGLADELRQPPPVSPRG